MEDAAARRIISRLGPGVFLDVLEPEEISELGKELKKKYRTGRLINLLSSEKLNAVWKLISKDTATFFSSSSSTFLTTLSNSHLRRQNDLNDGWVPFSDRDHIER